MKNFEQWRKERGESDSRDSIILIVFILICILVAAIAA